MKYKSEDKEEEKRVVHPVLKNILNQDIKFTEQFKSMARNNSVFRSLKIHHKLMEYSCHGIVWLCCVLGSLWIIGSPSYYQIQVNLLVALIIDIITIAILKAITRRRRPAPDNSSIGPDKFSFPSGHASRAAMIVYIFLNIHPVPYVMVLPLLAWATTVAVSRIVADKHYILDVVAGLCLGVVEGFLLSFFWLSEESSISLVNWLSDEKISGGEYHV